MPMKQRDIFEEIFSDDEPEPKKQSFDDLITPEQTKPKKFVDELDKLLRLYDQLTYAFEYESKGKIELCNKKFTSQYKILVNRYGKDDLF